MLPVAHVRLLRQRLLGMLVVRVLQPALLVGHHAVHGRSLLLEGHHAVHGRSLLLEGHHAVHADQFPLDGHHAAPLVLVLVLLQVLLLPHAIGVAQVSLAPRRSPGIVAALALHAGQSAHLLQRFRLHQTRAAVGRATPHRLRFAAAPVGVRLLAA